MRYEQSKFIKSRNGQFALCHGCLNCTPNFKEIEDD